MPSARHGYSAGDILIFLVLPALGPAAAAVVAAGDAFVGSWRNSRRWTSRLFSPAAATLAMTLAASLVHGLVSMTLMTGVLQLKRGKAFWQPGVILGGYRWVGLAYAGSAVMATLLFVIWRDHGPQALWVMLPLLLATLHGYFRQQQANERREAAG
ncbi:MAG: hypothetical protein O9343_00800 [Burkholderiaceae bacterium]|jgi:hypothetical protein|nr:hypothetical protein [Burkholderiaceae bacterium]MCZ8173704.1 hypothetical protein [Burkholderiaceae bacterium]